MIDVDRLRIEKVSGLWVGIDQRKMEIHHNSQWREGDGVDNNTCRDHDHINVDNKLMVWMSRMSHGVGNEKRKGGTHSSKKDYLKSRWNHWTIVADRRRIECPIRPQ